MQLADQPINPCLVNQVGANEFRLSKPNDPKEHQYPQMGLSKREYFAGMFVQAILSNPYLTERIAGNNGMPAGDPVVEIALNIADKLLDNLKP